MRSRPPLLLRSGSQNRWAPASIFRTRKRYTAPWTDRQESERGTHRPNGPGHRRRSRSRAGDSLSVPAPAATAARTRTSVWWSWKPNRSDPNAAATGSCSGSTMRWPDSRSPPTPWSTPVPTWTGDSGPAAAMRGWGDVMEWPLVPLEHICLINPKDSEVRRLPDDTLVSFVPMQAISEATATIVDDPPVRLLRDVRRGYTPFKDGDILFAKITPCMENGKCALATELENGIGFGSTEFHVLRPGPRLLPEFLHYYVRGKSFRATAKQHMRGGVGQQRVPEDFIRKEPIPLPPVSEQRRIVELLDQADRLRRLRAEADAKADRILYALYIKMFGDPVPSWTVARLADLLRLKKGALQSGPFGTHLHNHDFVRSGTVLAVGIDNVLDGEFVLGRNRRITPEKYEELTKYTLERGDVLITIMGTVGRTCVFPGLQCPAICTKHVYRIQLDGSVDPEYLSATMRFSERVRVQLGAGTTGQIVSGLTSGVLKRLVLVIPPIELQRAFATKKRRIEMIRNRARSNRERYGALFSILVHQALSAKLTTWIPSAIRDCCPLSTGIR